MAKFTEESLTYWTKPPSETEETKLGNAERMVREAIQENNLLKTKNIEIFGQGSYANDTNVKLNSDIDINVMLTGTVFFDIHDGKSREEHGYTEAQYTFAEFKNDVFTALVNKFGRDNVKRENKCITIKENTYRVKTDVVPTFKYNRHDSDGITHIGTKFISDTSNAIVNFPKQHIANGKTKNANTLKRFKRLTRIYRQIRYKMIEDGLTVNPNITSFLLECLVWNVPNSVLNDNTTWSDRLRQSIVYLYNKTKDAGECEKWGEVSELLYLFVDRKWSREDVKNYLVQMWNYLQLA